MRLGGLIKRHPLRSSFVGLLVPIVVLGAIGVVAGCDEEEPDMQRQSATQTQNTPVATPTSATSTPAPTEQPTHPTPTALPERCNAELRSQVPELVDWLRYAETTSGDLADTLDDAPTAVLLAEGDNLANQLYGSADSMDEFAVEFPDWGMSDDLREFGNHMRAIGHILEQGASQEVAAEAAEGFREIASLASRLADRINIYC